MIPDRPLGKDLLETVIADLKSDVLPSVDGDAKLTVLMAVSAIQTALREQESLLELQAEQIGAMAALATSATPSEDRARDLCASIRSGEFDGGDRARALYHALMDDAIARAEISNPKYLQAAEADWQTRQR